MATHSSIPAWKIPWTEEAGVEEATVHEVTKSWTRLSDWALMHAHSLYLSETENKGTEWVCGEVICNLYN